jgi:hypothetical protein
MYGHDWISLRDIQTKLRFENGILIKKGAQVNLAPFFISIPFIRDLDWIQTSNLLSRNQMRYSVAPRGLMRVQI